MLNGETKCLSFFPNLANEGKNSYRWLSARKFIFPK